MNDDGTVVAAFGRRRFPYEEVAFDDATDLVLTSSRQLAPGHYRLVLPGWSGLSGIDGSLAAAPDGSDLTLADFTIARPGVGLSTPWISVRLAHGPWP